LLVIPADAGIQNEPALTLRSALDSSLRRHEGNAGL
jgi:hypothetical protein